MRIFYLMQNIIYIFKELALKIGRYDASVILGYKNVPFISVIKLFKTRTTYAEIPRKHFSATHCCFNFLKLLHENINRSYLCSVLNIKRSKCLIMKLESKTLKTNFTMKSLNFSSY